MAGSILGQSRKLVKKLEIYHSGHFRAHKTQDLKLPTGPGASGGAWRGGGGVLGSVKSRSDGEGYGRRVKAKLLLDWHKLKRSSEVWDGGYFSSYLKKRGISFFLRLFGSGMRPRFIFCMRHNIVKAHLLWKEWDPEKMAIIPKPRPKADLSLR